jgi:hypothetical protein
MKKGAHMPERNPISHAEIKAALFPTTTLDNLMEAERRKAEERIHWFVYSAGTFIGDFVPHTDEINTSHAEFATRVKLRGFRRALNADTLVAATSYSLPKKMSVKGLEAMIESALSSETPDTSTTRFVGLVALNEPGIPIFAPSRMQLSQYLDSSSRGEDLAIEGMDSYLNRTRAILSDRERDIFLSDWERANELYEEYGELRHDDLVRAFVEYEEHQKLNPGVS